MAEFLFEIGLEEIPARMIAGAQAELAKKIMEKFSETYILDEDAGVQSFSTPRRLAVLVKGVREKQEDQITEELGPSVKIAYSKEGSPTPAANAFAKKFGLQVADLQVKSTPKGDYIQARVHRAGWTASKIIAQELPYILSSIYWAKNMYWRAGKPERFVRPVRWMVAVLDGDVVPVEFAGKTASRVTYGHRVLFGDAEIALKVPGDYEQALLKASVIADVEVRRQRIRKAMDHVTRTVDGMRWREDHELVDKLTHLVEWASDKAVVMGGFEATYLELPEEVLVTVMRDHQSYFAVEDKNRKLAAHFLAVLNVEGDEARLGEIRHGNERVLRARFNDARFFWEFDQRVPLVERAKLLENVTFQKDLGSYAKKTGRVCSVAAELAKKVGAHGCAVDATALDEAARLAKVDLTSELVKEFTELQGVVGGLYARAQGFSAAVGDAIYDQYLPKSMEDAVPRTVEGGLLAIADKADTIAGMFGLGLEPTGSKDPFALRRAANGVVKILAESAVALPIMLGDVADAATKEEAVRLRVEVFFAERLEFYLREVKGQAYDVVKAVLAVGANDVRDAVARAEAVTEVRGGEDFAAVSAAFKRMKNILAQAEEKGFMEKLPEVHSHKTMHPAQVALTEAADGIKKKFAALAEGHEYVAALELIATLRPQIDQFFEGVMVMDDDPHVRSSRLNLLDGLVKTFSKIADFSEIVVAGLGQI